MISRKIKVEERVISRSRKLRLITVIKTLIIVDITKTESNVYHRCLCYFLNLIIVVLHIERKNGSHGFASSLPGSSTKRAKLTCLPVTLSVLDMIQIL